MGIHEYLLEIATNYGGSYFVLIPVTEVVKKFGRNHRTINAAFKLSKMRGFLSLSSRGKPSPLRGQRPGGSGMSEQPNSERNLEIINFLLSSFTDNGKSLRAFTTNPQEQAITILTAGLLANSKLMISPEDASNQLLTSIQGSKSTLVSSNRCSFKLTSKIVFRKNLPKRALLRRGQRFSSILLTTATVGCSIIGLRVIPDS